MNAGWTPQPWSPTDSSSWPEKHSQFEAAVIGTGVRLAVEEIDAVARPVSREILRTFPPRTLQSREPKLDQDIVGKLAKIGRHQWERKRILSIVVGLFEAALDFADIFVVEFLSQRYNGEFSKMNLLARVQYNFYELILEFFFSDNVLHLKVI